jgi:DHA1 family multidrug resistance protein-like MFS transporter
VNDRCTIAASFALLPMTSLISGTDRNEGVLPQHDMKPAPSAPGTTRKLLALSLSIALAMSGVGIIIPVVPSHIGRLGLAGASTEQVALHVSLLAAGYAFMQLLLAPLWGRLSDSLGRRPLLAVGLIGFAVGQALCGLATSLLTLYAIRLGTGIFSAAIIPAAFAFVADTTSDEDRTRGMAQLSAAAGIGFVIGPAIGGLLGGIEPSAIGLPIATYSLPFFAAAGCALLALLTLRWLEEPAIPAAGQRPGRLAWTELARQIGLPLGVAIAGQVAIALFETTFARHARTDLGMGLVEIGVVFMVCGLMMLVVQLGAVPRLARRFGEVHLASVALALMGLSLALLALARSTAIVFALVSSYGIGMALLPAVSALVSRRGGAHAGAALGLESSAKSLGQIAGPVGGVLFGASVAVPFWLASGLLLGLAPIFAWSGRRTHEPPGGRAAKGKLAFRGQEAR